MNPTPDADLLRFLRNETQHCSLSEICEQLRWSPTQLADRLQVLRSVGYEIEEHPHLGIKLIGAPDRLIADDLFPPNEADRIGSRIMVFESTASTNDLAAKHGRDGEPDGLVIFAETQTSGRGRFGRRWESAPGEGLYFTLLLRPEFERHFWPQLTSWAAVGVAKAIEEVAACEAKIKWPNDIYLNGKKAVGILSEAHTDKHSEPFAIVGVGVNVNQQEFPPELSAIATSLRMEIGMKFDRRDLVVKIFQNLEETYHFLGAHFQEIVKEADRRSFLKGRWVRLEAGDSVVEGIAGTLDPNGALQIQQANGETVSVSSGEVTVSRIAKQ